MGEFSDKTIPARRQSLLKGGMISYALFLIYVIIYNFYNLHLGYAAHMDEGYLYSLAGRIIEGQIPYLDFYFLRTPLSLYIQAFFLYLFGDLHSIYLMRIIFTIQISILVILVSDTYRRYLNRFELLIALIISYTIVTMNIEFPWYSYDGLFFAGVALFFLNREKYILSGIALFLAGMSKQNYFLLFPAVIMVYSLFITEYKGKARLKDGGLWKIIAGFGATALFFMITFVCAGNLFQFISQAFLLPKKIGHVSLLFVLIQNNQDAIVLSLASIVIIIILHRFKVNRIASTFIIVLLLCFNATQLYSDLRIFAMNLVYINYTIALLFIYHRKDTPPEYKRFFKTMVLLFIVVQYLSGFNYSGLFFANMGAGLLLPLSYILFKDVSRSKLIPFILILALGWVAFHHKDTYFYRDYTKDLLTIPFESSKLGHLKSAERTVNRTDQLIKTIKENTDEDDYILAFPGYSPIYYLTDRRNPTKIDWYIGPEYNHEMLLEAIQALEDKQPEIILIDEPKIPAELQIFLEKYYVESEKIDYVTIYFPKR